MRADKYTLGVSSILLADPFLFEENFNKSVVLIARHSKKGYMGLILNKVSSTMIYEELEDFPEINAPIYYGGPVQTDSMIYYLHNYPQLEDCIRIQNGVYFGGNLEQLKLMIETNQVSTDQIRFFDGYLGWGPGQLEEEIDRWNIWLLPKEKVKNFFTESDEDLWESMLSRISPGHAVIANIGEIPGQN